MSLAGKLVLLIALALSACKGQVVEQGVLVTVDNKSGATGIVGLRAVVSNLDRSETLLLPKVAQSTPIDFPTQFSISVPSTRGGRVDIAIDGLDSFGVAVANGAGFAILQGSAFVGAFVDLVTVAIPPGTGGASGPAGTGGALGSGGVTGNGGAPPALGGTVGAGGVVGMGGIVGTGGAPSAGGAPGRDAAPGGGTTGQGGSGGTTSTAPSGQPIPSPGCSATPTTTSACTNTASAPCTIDVDGTQREYYLNLPAGYDGTKPVPVVWEYHPMGGNAKAGITMYGLNSKLTNVIFVSPQGLGSTSNFPNTGGQDENMTRAIMAEIEAKHCIDKTRHFTVGFSYGGAMSFTAACNMSDVFRAVGAMSGSTVSGATCANKQPQRKVAVWATHGDADTVLPISPAQSMIQALAKHNGCSTTTAPVDPSPCVAYQGCQEGYPVVWCVRPGDTHAIPSFGAAAIASFLQQHF